MRKRIVRYVNFYPPCDTTGPHPWRTTSWRTQELAERNKQPGRLTDEPVRVEFDVDRDPGNEKINIMTPGIRAAYESIERAFGNGDFAFDIGMALRKARIAKHGNTATERDQDISNIADQVMAHLRLCGWEFTRKAAPAAHSTHENRKDR